MAQLYRRRGGDILVNTQTALSQNTPSLAVLQDGGYVVAWTDSSLLGGDASGSAVKAQRFDSAGNKVGAEFLANTTVAGSQGGVVVATLPSGRFVMTWTDSSATGGDTSSNAVRGQLFEANGTPVGGEFLVNTQTANAQNASAVAELAGGGFVVTWVDASGVGGDSNQTGIKAQLFDASAGKVGGEFLVNTVTDGSQTQPSVIGLPTGGFAVGWTSSIPVNGFIQGSTRLQLFDSAGAKLGSEQVVNSTDNVNFNNTSIAALESGFVVTWAQQDSFQAVGFAITLDIRAQLFDWTGARVGSEFVVNTSTAGSQGAPDAQALPGGGFIVTWHGPGEGLTGFNIYAQIFDSAGARQGVEFIVGSVAEGSQSGPEVEVLPSGDIAVVWSDNSGTGGDSSGFAVKGQILTLSDDPPTDIALSSTIVSETAREGLPLATFSTVGALNSHFTYALVSDSSGGAFALVDGALVVADNSLLDFETAGQVQLRIRSTDDNGHSYEETIALTIGDTPETAYAPAGGEFVVPPSTDGFQNEPTFTPLASGGYLAQWFHSPTVFSNPVPKAQLFDDSGNPVGGELAIQGTVAALAGGGFVGIQAVPAGQPNMLNLEARLYDSAGNPFGSTIPVNVTSVGYQPLRSVAALPGGGFVVSWTRTPDSAASQIFARIFDSNGTAVGGEFQVSPSGGQVSDVATLESGNFVVAWESGGPIMAQIYTPDGIRFGVEFVANDPDLPRGEVHVVALAGGGFVITSIYGPGVNQLSAQVFDASGDRVGGEILISAQGPSTIQSTDVAALPWGGFVVAWSDEDSDQGTPDGRIVAQVFDATGQKLGDPITVSQAVGQANTDVTVLASGKILVGWAGQEVMARFLALGAGPTEGDDVIAGGNGNDILDGLGGNDVLTGYAGDDRLDGGTGADTMRGGGGDDVYVVDAAGDVVEEQENEGSDEIRTSLVTYSLVGTQVEILTAASDFAHEFRGNSAGNVLTGGDGNDFLLLQDGGDDVAFGGDGNDVLYFGAALSAGDAADGGAGRDALVFQGNVVAVLTDTNLVGIESISIQSGANARYGDTANNFYDYDVTTADGNVAAGQQLIVNAQSLRAGEDFTFDGSAELDGKFLIYGGHGMDDLTGGAGVDVFFFEGARWTAGDRVDGGAGRDALVISAGSGLTHIEFEADSFVNIESISVNNRYATDPSQRPSYELVLHNGNVAPGATLIVNGSSIPLGQVVSIDGRGVQDGNLILFGGGGHDTLYAGNGADLIVGGGGADGLAGGAGADTFRYDAASDSAVGLSDLIADFQTGVDKIDLSRIDANSGLAGDQAFTWIGAGAFSGAAGQLRTYEQGGYRWAAGDTDGDGTADFAIAFQVGTAPLVAGDFLL